MRFYGTTRDLLDITNAMAPVPDCRDISLSARNHGSQSEALSEGDTARDFYSSFVNKSVS